MSALHLELVDEDGDGLPDLLGCAPFPVTLERFDHYGSMPLFVICHWQRVSSEKVYQTTIIDKAPAAKAFIATRMSNVDCGIDRVLLIAPPTAMTDYQWLIDDYVDSIIFPAPMTEPPFVSYRTTNALIEYPLKDAQYELSYGMTIQNRWQHSGLQ